MKQLDLPRALWNSILRISSSQGEAHDLDLAWSICRWQVLSHRSHILPHCCPATSSSAPASHRQWWAKSSSPSSPPQPSPSQPTCTASTRLQVRLPPYRTNLKLDKGRGGGGGRGREERRLSRSINLLSGTAQNRNWKKGGGGGGGGVVKGI